MNEFKTTEYFELWLQSQPNPIRERLDNLLTHVENMIYSYHENSLEELDVDLFTNSYINLIGCDNNLCPKCNKPWVDHDFGVPTPYCP